MQHHRHFAFIKIVLIFLLMASVACTSIVKADGSFEESSESGRLHANLDEADQVSSFHFFRLHIRQFDDVLGGIFEIFEHNDYLAFSQEPEVLDRKKKNYYCSRIDNSYVRSNQIFITMTDREQRRWLFSSKLGDISLYGRLDRLSYDDRVMSASMDVDYLFPEDVLYRKKYKQPPLSKKEPISEQLVFEKMRRNNDKHLDCIYYYKTDRFKLELPSELQLKNWCMPSQGRCNNIRAAVMMTQLTYDTALGTYSLTLHEHQSARLDDCDIDPNGYFRLLSLREKPDLNNPVLKLGTATVIVYEDFDGNGLWTQESEPILSYASQGMLVFYEQTPNTTVYAKLSDGSLHDKALFDSTLLSASPGWYFLRYSSERDESGTSAQFVKVLESQLGNQIKLNPIGLRSDLTRENRGCYLKPNLDVGQVLCPPIFPAIAQ